jgi:hypothetical protein
VIGTIPLVGPVLGELAGTVIPDLRFRRLEQLAEELKGEVAHVADRLDAEYVRREEFATLFEDAVERAAQARNDGKTSAFAAFMAHSMVADRPSLSDRQRYLDILDELRPAHLQILAVLANGSEPHAAGPGAFTTGQAAAAALAAVLSQVEGADWEDLADLERRGLTRPMSGSSIQIATNVRSALLPLGLAFVDFVAADAPGGRKSRHGPKRARRADAPAAKAETTDRQLEQSMVPEPRLAILQELRNLNRKEARTSSILEFDIDGVAGHLGASVELVQDALVDLLAEGLAEPHAATFGRPAENGSCRITKAGMKELARLEAS